MWKWNCFLIKCCTICLCGTGKLKFVVQSDDLLFRSFVQLCPFASSVASCKCQWGSKFKVKRRPSAVLSQNLNHHYTIRNYRPTCT